MRAMMMAVQAHVLRTLLFDPAAIKLPKNRYLIQDNINMSRTALFAIYNTDWKQTKLEDIEQYMSSMSYCTKFIDGSTCEFKTLTSSCLTKTNRENLTEFGFRIHQQCRNASDRSDTTRRSGARPKRHYLEGRKRKNSHALLVHAVEVLLTWLDREQSVVRGGSHYLIWRLLPKRETLDTT